MEKVGEGGRGRVVRDPTGRELSAYYSHLYSLPKEPLAKLFFCHPEWSEGYQRPENTRFFTALRMTKVVNGEFYKRLKSLFLPPLTLTLSPRGGRGDKRKKLLAKAISPILD
jgi:hypothetical protein